MSEVVVVVVRVRVRVVWVRVVVGMVHEKKNFFDIDSAKLRLWI